MSEVKGDVLKLKKRGEDGNRVITVRIKEETLSEIDRIAKEIHKTFFMLILLDSYILVMFALRVAVVNYTFDSPFFNFIRKVSTK